MATWLGSQPLSAVWVATHCFSPLIHAAHSQLAVLRLLSWMLTKFLCSLQSKVVCAPLMLSFPIINQQTSYVCTYVSCSTCLTIGHCTQAVGYHLLCLHMPVLESALLFFAWAFFCSFCSLVFFSHSLLSMCWTVHFLGLSSRCIDCTSTLSFHLSLLVDYRRFCVFICLDCMSTLSFICTLIFLAFSATHWV